MKIKYILAAPALLAAPLIAEHTIDIGFGAGYRHDKLTTELESDPILGQKAKEKQTFKNNFLMLNGSVSALLNERLLLQYKLGYGFGGKTKGSQTLNTIGRAGNISPTYSDPNPYKGKSSLLTQEFMLGYVVPLSDNFNLIPQVGLKVESKNLSKFKANSAKNKFRSISPFIGCGFELAEIGPFTLGGHARLHQENSKVTKTSYDTRPLAAQGLMSNTFKTRSLGIDVQLRAKMVLTDSLDLGVEANYFRSFGNFKKRPISWAGTLGNRGNKVPTKTKAHSQIINFMAGITYKF